MTCFATAPTRTTTHLRLRSRRSLLLHLLFAGRSALVMDLLLAGRGELLLYLRLHQPRMLQQQAL